MKFHAIWGGGGGGGGGQNRHDITASLHACKLAEEFRICSKRDATSARQKSPV